MKWLETVSGSWCCSPCLDQGRHSKAMTILNEDVEDGVQREGLCGNHAELVNLGEDAEEAAHKERQQ
jgi:hypothetical protein